MKSEKKAYRLYPILVCTSAKVEKIGRNLKDFSFTMANGMSFYQLQKSKQSRKLNNISFREIGTDVGLEKKNENKVDRKTELGLFFHKLAEKNLVLPKPNTCEVANTRTEKTCMLKLFNTGQNSSHFRLKHKKTVSCLIYIAFLSHELIFCLKLLSISPFFRPRVVMEWRKNACSTNSNFLQTFG